MKVDPRDKELIFEWMDKYCKPSYNAKNKEEILKYVRYTIPNMNERMLRYIIGELKDENRVGALSSMGYFVPGSHDDPKECHLMIASWMEMFKRAFNMITRAKANIKYWKDRLLKIEQGQLDMFNKPVEDIEIGEFVDDVHKIGGIV